MVQCKKYTKQIEVHKVSKVVTHKIALISNSSKYHIYFIWAFNFTTMVKKDMFFTTMTFATTTMKTWLIGFS
jgi:hypothetical protein